MAAETISAVCLEYQHNILCTEPSTSTYIDTHHSYLQQHVNFSVWIVRGVFHRNGNSLNKTGQLALFFFSYNHVSAHVACSLLKRVAAK